jgi:hypothetical protein
VDEPAAEGGFTKPCWVDGGLGMIVHDNELKQTGPDGLLS